MTLVQYSYPLCSLFSLLINIIKLNDGSGPVSPQQIGEWVRDIFAGYDDDHADILNR